MPTYDADMSKVAREEYWPRIAREHAEMLDLLRFVADPINLGMFSTNVSREAREIVARIDAA